MNTRRSGQATHQTRLVAATLALAWLLAGCAPAATPSPTALPTLPPTAAPTATPAAPAVSHIYAFGDSYSDNGLAQKLGPSWPMEVDWQGRFSNGPTGVEVLATRLNVALNDYAVGGARSDSDNIDPAPGLQNTGGLSQVANFSTDLKGSRADPNAVYFIMLGANDYLGDVLGDQTTDVSATATGTAFNIATIISQLAKLGAKRFLVISSLDLANMPIVVSKNRSAEASQLQTLLNSKVSGRAAQLGSALNLDIKLFDYVALSAQIRAHPADYGLTNLTDACQPTLDQVLPACASPDQYYFWDEIHPTRRVHQIFGEAWAALYQPR